MHVALDMLSHVLLPHMSPSLLLMLLQHVTSCHVMSCHVDVQNRRPEYIASWWHVINWPYAEQLFDEQQAARAKQEL